jgi:hypothetical protein
LRDSVDNIDEIFERCSMNRRIWLMNFQMILVIVRLPVFRCSRQCIFVQYQSTYWLVNKYVLNACHVCN